MYPFMDFQGFSCFSKVHEVPFFVFLELGGNTMKKALLVGINNYPASPLNGCVNDVNNMANELVTNYNFEHDNVRLLVDERATKIEIIARLNWLVDCKPGDVIYFHYSGHGTQVASRNANAEVDNLNECICPVDFSWDPNHYITDKELYEIFSKIPHGVAFFWLSDSCHSGDLTRDILVHKKRFIRPPADLAWRVRTAKSKGLFANRSVSNGVLDVGYISGCRSDQTSADAFIDGKSCGAFTHFFLKNLKTMRDKPLDDLTDAVRKDLKNNGYSQQPQVEGTRVRYPFCN